MKKAVSLFGALLLVVSLGGLLTSCFHTCDFSGAWVTDDTHHWHVCAGEDCPETADFAAHTWDEGVITEKATQEKEGVRTFTCTACAKTRTESVAFAGLDATEWAAAFEDAAFENFAYKESTASMSGGIALITENTYRFTKHAVFVQFAVEGDTQESYVTGEDAVRTARVLLLDSVRALTAYEKFAYDAESKTYRAKEAIEIEGTGASAEDVTITFAYGRPAMIRYSVSYKLGALDFTETTFITFSEYGGVVLKPAA